MQEGESQVAVGGVQYRQAGCLLIPFLPVKAAGALIITTKRIIFEPILHYKLFTRKFDIDLETVAEAEAAGNNVQWSVWELVSIGKSLTVKLKNGAAYRFRSMEADQLAEVINILVRGNKG